MFQALVKSSFFLVVYLKILQIGRRIAHLSRVITLQSRNKIPVLQGITNLEDSYKCPEGYYCPEGTKSRTQFGCPVGKFRDTVGAASPDECNPCTPSMSAYFSTPFDFIKFYC